MACTRSSPIASSCVRGGSTSSASGPSGSRATTIRAPATRCSTPTRSSSSSSASTTTSRRRRRRSSAPTWNRTSATVCSLACDVIRAAAIAVLLVAAAPAVTAAPQRRSTTCVEDDQVPTPPGYNGWERSSVVAWEAVEAQGGIVPDIDEDRTHFPPAWLRYPSPLRSADLLADEARKPKGLYTKVEANDIQPGDIVVRVKGAGACGKMAVVAGRSDDQWIVLDTEGEKAQPPSGPPAMGEALPGQASAAVFFDGAKPRPETSIYRLAVKKDSSLGHVRELT